jgi:uncharacterized protein (DUF433 family)
VLQKLGDGVEQEELLRSYPRLRPEHIQAAQSFAAACLSSDEMILLGEEAG